MRRPKIGLALGSGGALGYAHAGVIKALEDNGIPIDMIAGSSIGALVGAVYASGLKVDQMRRFALSFNRNTYVDVTVPRKGFVSGKRLKNLLYIITKGKNLEDLPIPIAVVATDIQLGEKVVFHTGNIAETVRASISIPGVFVPAVIDGRTLVDGGVIERVPVADARELGADIVIAVNVSTVRRNAPVNSILDVLMQSFDIMQYEILHNRIISSDVMIIPDLKNMSSFDYSKSSQVIDLGEKATLAQMDTIKQLIKDWKEKNC